MRSFIAMKPMLSFAISGMAMVAVLIGELAMPTSGAIVEALIVAASLLLLACVFHSTTIILKARSSRRHARPDDRQAAEAGAAILTPTPERG